MSTETLDLPKNTTTAAVDESRPAAPVRKPRKSLHLSQISVLDVPMKEDLTTPILKDDGYKGKPTFHFYAATEQCQPIRLQCTRRVYQFIKDNPATTVMAKNVTFVVQIDPDTKIVEDISKRDKPGLAGFGVASDKTAADSSNHLVIARYPDQSIEISQSPTRMHPDQTDEILRSLNDNPNIQPGEKIAGKYTVVSVNRLVGKDDIHVDPMPRNMQESPA